MFRNIILYDCILFVSIIHGFQVSSHTNYIKNLFFTHVHISLFIALQFGFLTYLCVASNDNCTVAETCSVEETLRF